VSSPGESPVRGLRERKKARTRASVQTIALNLFSRQGYDATTIEQIATLAEISESTFFRYFPTKEHLVISDDLDPLLIETFKSLPPEIGVFEALRYSLRKTFGDLSLERLVRLLEIKTLYESGEELVSTQLHNYLMFLRRNAVAEHKREMNMNFIKMLRQMVGLRASIELKKGKDKSKIVNKAR